MFIDLHDELEMKNLEIVIFWYKLFLLFFWLPNVLPSRQFQTGTYFVAPRAVMNVLQDGVW
jgi:hypothetical protein